MKKLLDKPFLTGKTPSLKKAPAKAGKQKNTQRLSPVREKRKLSSLGNANNKTRCKNGEDGKENQSS